MKKILLPLLALTITLSVAVPRLDAACTADEQDYDESVRLPVRRLHPERPTKEKKRQMEAEKESRERSKSEIDDEIQAGFGTAGKKKKTQQTSGKKTAEEKALLDKLLNNDYEITDLRAEMMKPKKWKDEPVHGTKASLMPYCTREEVGSGSLTEYRYRPKTAPKDEMSNGLFLYFDVKGGLPVNLRLRGQYYADDPLVFDKIVFTIDGFNYEYVPVKVNRGKNGRFSWENCDEPLRSKNKDLLYALTHCSWVRVTFVGTRGFNHVRTLNDKEVKDFYHVFELYRVLGGMI